ncbi:MAG: tRNA (guanosine(46)-N7)-methyltransferase TrmB [Rhizobiaceae bacterium]|nr:tRNA (guanosine(46)-N7)-methyltransferase TrmB [Rhizobiaceae bacterium]
MSGSERPKRASEAFFGRRKGKTIRPFQAEALEGGLRRYGLDLASPPPSDLRTLFQAPVERVRIEIGFGGGEHLLAAATVEPTSGFIGVEPFVNGMAKMTAALAEAALSNLRLFDDDATRLLDWLPPASIAGIDLFYPDPWTKRRHWKRRFVNEANLDRFARVLRPGGLFRFASDISGYVEWTCERLDAHPDFVADLGGRAPSEPYPGWPGTRYEAKALREGRSPAYWSFRRT